MGFAPMEFDRVWTKASDFPTYEAHEETVRADMQYLYDVIKNHYNKHIRQELNAENMPFTPTPGVIEKTTIQEAIEYVNQRVQDSFESNIADGSITYDKLRQVSGEEAVGTNAIRDGAVTGDKIADYTITRTKIAPGAIPGSAIVDDSITNDKMGDDSVNTDQLVNNCVTEAKLGNKSVKTNRIDDKAVTTEKIGDGAVKNEQIYDGAVTHEKIGTGEVYSTNIAAEAVVSAKIKAGAVSYEKTDGSIQKKHITATATLASGTDSWSVTVVGVTSSNTVICTPAPNAYVQWVDNRIRCTGQSADTLTFASDTNTTEDVVVNILILD